MLKCVGNYVKASLYKGGLHNIEMSLKIDFHFVAKAIVAERFSSQDLTFRFSLEYAAKRFINFFRYNVMIVKLSTKLGLFGIFI